MRLALIGGHGHHYVRQLLKAPNSPIDSPIAFAGDGVDDAQAKKFADAMDVPTIWFADVRQMYESFQPQLVSVGAVYAFNGDLAADALERGIPTITDKPIAVTAQQLSRLKQITSKADCPPLITEYDFRARPEFVAARDAIAAGSIGQVVMISIQKSYRFNTRPDWYGRRDWYGGTLMWVLSHAIDFIPFATGQTFKRITGHNGNASKPQFAEFDDRVAILGELTGGATAIAHGDMIRPQQSPSHGDDRMRILGSDGQIDVIEGSCTLTTHNAPPEIIARNEIGSAGKKGVGIALFNAAMQGDESLFSTRASIDSAELMLVAREAVEGRRWKEVG